MATSNKKVKINKNFIFQNHLLFDIFTESKNKPYILDFYLLLLLIHYKTLNNIENMIFCTLTQFAKKIEWCLTTKALKNCLARLNNFTFSLLFKENENKKLIQFKTLTFYKDERAFIVQLDRCFLQLITTDNTYCCYIDLNIIEKCISINNPQTIRGYFLIVPFLTNLKKGNVLKRTEKWLFDYFSISKYKSESKKIENLTKIFENLNFLQIAFIKKKEVVYIYYE